MKIKTLVSVKTIFENKIKGLKSERQLFKKDDYFLKAKEIWELIDRDFGISTTIESVLKLKLDKFEQMLTSKFPELTSEEVEKIKQSMIRDFRIEKLYEISDSLSKDNKKITEGLSKFKQMLSENSEKS